MRPEHIAAIVAYKKPFDVRAEMQHIMQSYPDTIAAIGLGMLAMAVTAKLTTNKKSPSWLTRLVGPKKK